MKQLLSMIDVAKMWNVKTANPARTVRRMLQAIETDRNITILQRKKRYFYTTETLLRNAMPEMFREDNNTLESLRAVKDTINELTLKVNRLTARILELESKAKEGSPRP